MSEKARPSVPGDQLNPNGEGGQRTFRGERPRDTRALTALVVAVGAFALTGCGGTARAETPRIVTVAPAVVPAPTPEYIAPPEPQFIYTGKPYSAFPEVAFGLETNTSYTQEEIAERVGITLADVRAYERDMSQELIPPGSDQTTKDSINAMSLFMENLRILTATTDKTFGEIVDAAAVEALAADPSAIEELLRFAATLRAHGNGAEYAIEQIVTAHSVPGNPTVEVFAYVSQTLETDQPAYTPDVVQALRPYNKTVWQVTGGFDEEGQFKVSSVTTHQTNGHTFNGMPLNSTED